jgi:hypothetical protein
MGVFGDIEGFGKVVRNVIDGRDEPTPSSTGMSARLGDAVKGVTGSEILDAGQLLIAGMRLTTGWGDPTEGEPFQKGAARFAGAGETVDSAYPSDDWQGDAAEAYANANRRQAGQTASMALLDRKVQFVIAGEAFQVSYHRDKLDDQSNYLGGLGYATWAIALIPGVGKAMKAAFELAAVNAALGICSFELYNLSREAGENAARLQQIAGEYSALTERKPAPPDLDDAPPQPPSDAPPGPDSTDERAPDRLPVAGAPAPWPGIPSASASTGSPAAEEPSPAPRPPAKVAADAQASPAEPEASSAMPADAMSGMASALGAVGGMIGSMVAPLAAVLTGVAGAAGQSLSTLTSAGAADPVAEATDSTGDDGRAPEDAVDDEPADEDAATRDAGVDGVGAVPPDVAAESEGASPQNTDKLEPERPPPLPAPTRPPH